jgi:hypothetical protein
MTTPGFTAEASLGKVKETYILTSVASAETGGVVPQFCFRSPGSNYVTCGECVDIDGDGVPDVCWTYTHRLAATLI